MLRTFEEHEVRNIQSLDGCWDFVTEDERKGRSRVPRSYTRTIQVPSAWELLPGLEQFRGKAWLRTRMPAVQGHALRLVFGGVSHTGKVYVDGKAVGSHYDAFTPWELVVPGLSAGMHELVVEVDNAFGAHSALHLENDYMTYGGITRPVELQYVPPVYLERMHATPQRKGETWSLAVTVRLRNWSAESQRRRLVLEVAGTTVELPAVTVRGGRTSKLTATIDCGHVETWSPSTPVLHYLKAFVFDGDTVVDDLVDRIGFRDIQVCGRSILLNGQPVRLRGYNRHEDHPQFGNAIPREAMAADLAIIGDLGCNMVRTCHYPNDQRFLDLCDQLGFFVWEESHARSVSFKHPRFREQIAQSTDEMVDWHFNHPCIIMWGCLNECDSVGRAGRGEYTRVIKQLKRLDPSRPVTFASDKRKRDTCLGLVDIVSWNLYTGWYGERPHATGDVVNDLLKWLHSDESRGGKGKPVILSEFGAGAIYGCREQRKCHWSEEYQAEVLDENLRVYLNHPAISGAIAWQFCDCRVTAGFWQTRPRTMNNKGTVDEYRRPKLAYETVKARMLEAAERWDG